MQKRGKKNKSRNLISLSISTTTLPNMGDEFKMSIKLRVFLFNLHMLCNHFVEYIFTRQTFGLAESDTRQSFLFCVSVYGLNGVRYI